MEMLTAVCIASTLAAVIAVYGITQSRVAAILERALDRLEEEKRHQTAQAAEQARDRDCAVGEGFERRRELYSWNRPRRGA